MGEKAELKQELEQELEWIKYRQNMLDVIEHKLLEMKELAVQTKEGNLTSEEIEKINARINSLAAQVNALDEESKKTEVKGIGE